MSVAPGSKLGPYEVLSPLGFGGMGEVYKAKDTRLNRSVALKVLPSELARDPSRKARLEREAKAISKLSHAHICTLHDVGAQDGIEFLVMEYLEGETLADRLKRGALPLDQALEYARQMASALAAAHELGIVHRDLKPSNVMLTKSGVKLLDFGLARLRPAGFGEAGPEESAITEARPLTQEGAILGTIAYMSPEQLEGKEADARSDIYAFGAVLYEMVTGERIFDTERRRALAPARLEEIVSTALGEGERDVPALLVAGRKTSRVHRDALLDRRRHLDSSPRRRSLSVGSNPGERARRRFLTGWALFRLPVGRVGPPRDLRPAVPRSGTADPGFDDGRERARLVSRRE
jgi:serine/threonine protein kinase